MSSPELVFLINRLEQSMTNPRTDGLILLASLPGIVSRDAGTVFRPALTSSVFITISQDVISSTRLMVSRFSSFNFHMTNPCVGVALGFGSLCCILKFVSRGKGSEVSNGKTEADIGCSVEKMLSINEWEMVVTRVGIVVEGYMFEADIIMSRSITPDDRGRVRLMLKSPAKLGSFLCLSRDRIFGLSFPRTKRQIPPVNGVLLQVIFSYAKVNSQASSIHCRSVKELGRINRYY